MRRKRKRPIYYEDTYKYKDTWDPYGWFDKGYTERMEKSFCKKSRLWQEVEALFWALVFKEEIERDLPDGCTWVQKAPGCP